MTRDVRVERPAVPSYDAEAVNLTIGGANLRRALGLLAHPRSAVSFADEYWPHGRTRPQGKRVQAGCALLRQLVQHGYVTKQDHGGGAHDLYVVASNSPRFSEDVSQNVFEEVPKDGSEDEQRLQRLVALARKPVEGVEHDAALGDLRVHGHPVGPHLANVLAVVVLDGSTANLYPPDPDDDMICGVTPSQAAHALFVRWQQSGVPPKQPDPVGLVFLDDGIAASNQAEDWDTTMAERMDMQRRGAGLPALARSC